MPDPFESQSQFEELDDSVFADLLDSTPAQTAGPSDVIGGTKPAEAPKDKPKEDKPKEDPKKDEPKEKTDEEVAKDLEEVADEDPAKPAKDIKPSDVPEDTTAALLKAKAMGLIERGIWKEVKDLDTFEWTDENYGELAQAQAQWSAEDAFNEMLDQSGDYGKAIFDHIKNGGDPKEIIDLFKEAKRVNSMDITEESGQQTIIREYYSKVMKWSDAKITRFINGAIDNKALKDEATEIKNLLEEEIKTDMEARKQAAADELKQRQEVERNWANSISGALKSREDLTDKEKRELHQSLLVYNQKLGDGRQVNQFTIDFMKLQSDPQKYIELVRFVQDPDKYMKKIEKTKEKEAAKKTWEFVKGNAAVTKGGGSHAKQEPAPSADLKIDWKTAYK